MTSYPYQYSYRGVETADAAGVIEKIVFDTFGSFMIFNDKLRTDSNVADGEIKLEIQYLKKACGCGNPPTIELLPPVDVIYPDNQTKSDSLDKHVAFNESDYPKLVSTTSTKLYLRASGLAEGDKVFYEVFVGFVNQP